MSSGSNRINTHPVLGSVEPAEPFEIFVDGQPVEALKGDTVAAALLAANTPVLRYTSSGKSPRGLFCGVGRCGDCFMQIDGRPGQPACTTPAQAGQSVIISANLPAAPFPASSGSNEPVSQRSMWPDQADLVIVGAGFAGAGVALAVAESSRKIWLVDEKPELFFDRKADLSPLPVPPPELAAVFPELNQPGLYPFQVAALLQARLNTYNNVNLLNRTAAVGLFCAGGTNRLVVTTAADSHQIVGKRIVLATGSYSQPPAFPGWTLPGVLLEQAALDLLHRYRVKLRQPVLIGGSGPRAVKLAQYMRLAGVETPGIVGLQPPTGQNPVGWTSVNAAVPFQNFEGYFLGRAEGSQQVEQVTLFPVDPQRGQLKLEVGSLVLVAPEAPLVELAAQAGARFAARRGVNRKSPHSLISEANETGLPGVYLTGKAAGISNEPDGWQTLLDGWQLGGRIV